MNDDIIRGNPTCLICGALAIGVTSFCSFDHAMYYANRNHAKVALAGLLDIDDWIPEELPLDFHV